MAKITRGDIVRTNGGWVGSSCSDCGNDTFILISQDVLERRVVAGNCVQCREKNYFDNHYVWFDLVNKPVNIR